VSLLGVTEEKSRRGFVWGREGREEKRREEKRREENVASRMSFPWHYTSFDLEFNPRYYLLISLHRLLQCIHVYGKQCFRKICLNLMVYYFEFSLMKDGSPNFIRSSHTTIFTILNVR